MPWKCPACQTEIRHEGETPVPKRIYRCHICRLELTLDKERRDLTLAPFPTARHNRGTSEPKS